MGAVRMLASARWRGRWTSVVLLTLLVGFVGVVVLASVAGARRTASALTRFDDESLAADVEVNAGFATPEQMREFARTPDVATIGELRQLTLFNNDVNFLPTAGPTTPVFGNRVDRARLVAGREARRADEITVGEGFVERFGFHLGDRVSFQSLSPEQIERELESGPLRGEGPEVTLRVVGIVRRPLDLGGRGAAGGVLVLTRAFVDEYGDRIGSYAGSVLRVRTRHGAADVPEVVAAARRIFGRNDSFQTLSLAVEGEAARSAIDVTTVALWLVAAVAGLAGAVAIAIALARYMAPASADQEVLRALGARPRERWAATFATTVPIAVVGAVVAGIGAWVASPIFPIGVARDAEPDPGFRADGLVLFAGAATVAAIVLAIGALAALVTTARRERAFSRPALPSAAASRAGLPPVVATGMSFALERGHGRGGVPVGSSLVGASLGVVGVVAALLFGASFDHLVSTPRLFGWTWDVIAVDASVDAPGCTRTSAFAHEPGIDAVASLCLGEVTVDDQPVPAYGFLSSRGHIGPAIVEGRGPVGRSEVALGATTLRNLHKDVGDSVRIAAPAGSRRYRVVGRSVFPTISVSDAQPLADGVVLTPRAMRRARANNDGYFLVRLAPGVDGARTRARLQRAGGGFVPVASTVPTEVDRLEQIDAFPVVIAAFVAVVALVAVGYALATAVRRRRRDLAILKTLGYRRGQVRATVAWHATTVAVIGIVVGVPLGLVVGRLIWERVADSLGVVTTPTVPVALVFVVALTTLVVANAMAAFPARTAAKTRPSIVLRSE
jgi:hypothetical protein